MNRDKKIIILSLYVAMASVLQMSENLLPSILPGIRIGFANIITLIVLYKYAFKHAMIVAVLRVIVSSLLLGTFLGPSFVLSFSGAVVSAMIMGIIYKPVREGFSIIGISILGALSHILTQFFIVYYLFVLQANLLWMLPVIIIGSILSGIVTGLIARFVIRKEFRM
ncbi:MAG: Gx transporter family protein [Elusimicrobiota bacterium]